jgi:N-acetylglucosamine-6-phosphate deacetylase
MRFTLRGARLVDAVTDRADVDLTIEDDRILGAGNGRIETGRVIDAAGMIVTPGFTDVHTHGGGGFNLHTRDASAIRAYSTWVPRTGVTSFLVGVVGSPDGLPEAELSAAVAALEGGPPGAEPLGIHLEGPYISALRRGAHLPAWLRTPDHGETERILALTRGHLRIMTLAPELPGAHALIRRLVGQGVTVGIGHTDATYEQTLEAIRLGATYMTHCCNAMRPLHHRDPGPLSAVADAEQVCGELIADGVHVHPAMMRVVVKLLGPGRTVTVTDALAAAGMPDIVFDFAGQPARVEHGVARLADGTITGSVLTMDQALRNVVAMTGVSLVEAVGMQTLNPARAARAEARKGRLVGGYDADVLILDAALRLHATLCRGRLAYFTSAWRERLRGIPRLPKVAKAVGVSTSGLPSASLPEHQDPVLSPARAGAPALDPVEPS